VERMVIAAKYIRFSVINALMLHGRQEEDGGKTAEGREEKGRRQKERTTFRNQERLEKQQTYKSTCKSTWQRAHDIYY
jgi:hypothetical protein